MTNKKEIFINKFRKLRIVFKSSIMVKWNGEKDGLRLIVEFLWEDLFLILLQKKCVRSCIYCGAKFGG